MRRLPSSRALPPANNAIDFKRKKTISHHDLKNQKKINQQYTPFTKKNDKRRKITEKRNIVLSSENSNATLFTTLSKEAKHDPNLTTNNSQTQVMSKVKNILCQF